MIDQPQNVPPSDPDATGDMPAALGPDTPTEVQPGDETVSSEAVAPVPPTGPDAPAARPDAPAAAPDAPAAAPDAPAAPPPPPPPPAIATAMESQSGGEVSPPVDNAPVSDSWRPEDDGPSGPAAVAAERPEVAIGAAFAGGLVLALILKRLAR